MGLKNKVNFKVELISDGDPPRFNLIPTPSLPKWNTKKNDFAFYNNGKDGFELRYKLHGEALGYRFPDDKDEALYSALGTNCPKTKGQWEQFKAKDVEDSKTLVVINSNLCEAEFAYTLRVKKTLPGGEIKCLNLDPGGLNKNGPAQVAGVAQAIAVAVGATAATVLALVSFGLLKRRSERRSR